MNALQENIDLDLKNLLDTAINTEIINQRKLAKQQYLESQGFSAGAGQISAGMALANVTGNTAI